MKNLLRKKYKTYLNDAFNDLDRIPKKFWGLVKIKGNKCVYPS